MLASGGLLWFLNQGPDFPDISYVPKNNWGGIDWSSNAPQKPGGRFLWLQEKKVKPF
jgi:hypothetical protein